MLINYGRANIPLWLGKTHFECVMGGARRLTVKFMRRNSKVANLEIAVRTKFAVIVLLSENFWIAGMAPRRFRIMVRPQMSLLTHGSLCMARPQLSLRLLLPPRTLHNRTATQRQRSYRYTSILALESLIIGILLSSHLSHFIPSVLTHYFSFPTTLISGCLPAMAKRTRERAKLWTSFAC